LIKPRIRYFVNSIIRLYNKVSGIGHQTTRQICEYWIELVGEIYINNRIINRLNTWTNSCQTSITRIKRNDALILPFLWWIVRKDLPGLRVGYLTIAGCWNCVNEYICLTYWKCFRLLYNCKRQIIATSSICTRYCAHLYIIRNSCYFFYYVCSWHSRTCIHI
jgi:hypothetical protein